MVVCRYCSPLMWCLVYTPTAKSAAHARATSRQVADRSDQASALLRRSEISHGFSVEMEIVGWVVGDLLAGTRAPDRNIVRFPLPVLFLFDGIGVLVMAMSDSSILFFKVRYIIDLLFFC